MSLGYIFSSKESLQGWFNLLEKNVFKVKFPAQTMGLNKTTWWFSDENKAITLKPWLYNPNPEIEKKNFFRKRRILSMWLKQQNLTLILIASLNLNSNTYAYKGYM